MILFLYFYNIEVINKLNYKFVVDLNLLLEIRKLIYVVLIIRLIKIWIFSKKENLYVFV